MTDCDPLQLNAVTALEEVIYQRQLAKESLAVFDSAKSKEKFTKEELADCFNLKDGCSCDTKLKVGRTWSDYGKLCFFFCPPLADDLFPPHKHRSLTYFFPNVAGPESLVDQGDNPLVQVASNHRGVVSFVHVVEEKETLAIPQEDEAVKGLKNEEIYDSDDASSDDEFEL